MTGHLITPNGVVAYWIVGLLIKALIALPQILFNMADFKMINGILHKLVFRRFIVKNNERIYPKRARCFVFWVPVV